MYEANKGLGQNFMLDYSLPARMVRLINPTGGDVIVEIGAGLGVLTQALSDSILGIDAEVHVVEIDERFIPKLNSMFENNLRLEIVNADVLTWLPKFTPSADLKIIGSLPYYLTSPIIHLIVKHPNKIKKCVFLIQKEVAEKIGGTPPKGSYFSNFVRAFYDVEVGEEVSKYVFDPVPKVDGRVIIFTERKEKLIEKTDICRYEKFLHHAFSSPRKMLNKVFRKDSLEKYGVDPSLRPQNLSVEEWVRLFKLI